MARFSASTTGAEQRALEPHLFVGLALVAFFWAASWGDWGALGEYSFFPLWLGYILTVDGLVARRRGASLLTTRPRHFVALFFISAPLWWLFEGLNHFTLNWHYFIPAHYSALQIIAQATINFAIVVPAVFETTALLATFSFMRRLRTERVTFRPTPATYQALMLLGAAMFFAVWLLPNLAFGLIWVWLFLIVDSQNARMRRPALIEQAARGDFRNVVALALGTLICGFFWEMWNFYAFPKWYYTVPIVGFWHVFEMPLLGYIGYIPFAWELYALYQFVCGIFRLEPVSFDE